jgi:hypothetical protein
VNLTPEQLEWIVSEVVRRLRAGGAESTQPTAPSTSQLAIDERLVTLETLRNRLDKVSTLKVPAKAIVTPAVVDRLKELNIQLVRA